MHITILAFGSQGDVQPYAALGRGLAEAGYSVTLGSHETFQGLAKLCGLGFSKISGNPRDIVHGQQGRSWLDSTDNYVRFFSRAQKLAKDIYPGMAQDALAASQGSDALIYSLPLTVCGYSISQALRVPGIPAALYPLHPTRAFPSIMTPGLSLGPGVNWLSGTVVMHLFWQLSRSLLGAWHKQLGLGRLPVLPPLMRLEKAGIPFLYGYSPSVMPRPSSWPAGRAVCGYWKELTVASLEKAIRSVLDSAAMTAQAGKLAKAIKAEDGIAAAVKTVENYLRSTTRRRIA